MDVRFQVRRSHIEPDTHGLTGQGIEGLASNAMPQLIQRAADPRVASGWRMSRPPLLLFGMSFSTHF